MVNFIIFNILHQVVIFFNLLTIILFLIEIFLSIFLFFFQNLFHLIRLLILFFGDLIRPTQFLFLYLITLVLTFINSLVLRQPKLWLICLLNSDHFAFSSKVLVWTRNTILKLGRVVGSFVKLISHSLRSLNYFLVLIEVEWILHKCEIKLILVSLHFINWPFLDPFLYFY